MLVIWELKKNHAQAPSPTFKSIWSDVGPALSIVKAYQGIQKDASIENESSAESLSFVKSYVYIAVMGKCRRLEVRLEKRERSEPQ